MIIYGLTPPKGDPESYGTNKAFRDINLKAVIGTIPWQYEIPESVTNPVENPLPTKHGSHIKATFSSGGSDELVLLNSDLEYPWVGWDGNFSPGDFMHWEPIYPFSVEELIDAVFEHSGVLLEDNRAEVLHKSLFL
jgi:hypothetical protein